MFPINHPILTFSPEDGTGGGVDAGPGGTGQGSAPTGAPASPPAAPEPSGGGGGDPFAVVAGQKPEGLPEKFWNGDLKQIRLPELMKGYAEAEALIGRRVEQLSQPEFLRLVDTKVNGMMKELEAKAVQNVRGVAPKEPKDYQVQMSPEVMQKLPEPMQNLAQYESDPLVGWFKEFAHKAGLGQAQFQQGFEQYLDIVAQSSRASAASEQSKLGDNGPKRMEQLSNWLDRNLEKRQAAALRNSLGTAEAFAAVESLVKKFADPSLIRGFADAGDMGRVGPGLSSEAEIKQAMKDPRYWDTFRRDPGYVKAIENAWNRLYGRGNGQA